MTSDYQVDELETELRVAVDATSYREPTKPLLVVLIRVLFLIARRLNR